MKKISFTLAIAAIIALANSSCEKSSVTPAIANSTVGATSQASAHDNGDEDDDDNDGAKKCGMYCTYTQEQFGATSGPAKNIMYAHFYEVYPNGFSVGSKKCNGGHTVFISSPQAVTKVLPVYGTPAKLTKDYKDQSPKNELVGQLVALSINIDMAKFDPMYSSSLTAFGDMIIGSGCFKGMTVKDFFSLANDVLAGGNKKYTPAQANDQAKQINENYKMIGAEYTDKGYLVCPGNNHSGDNDDHHDDDNNDHHDDHNNDHHDDHNNDHQDDHDKGHH